MTMVYHVPRRLPVFCDSGITWTPQVQRFIQILDEEYERLITAPEPYFLLSEESFLPALGSLDKIPVIISPETPTREYTMTDRELAEQIIEELFYLKLSRGEAPVDVVEKRIKNRKRKEKLAGTYHHEGCPKLTAIESETVDVVKGGPYIKIYYYHFTQEDEEGLRVALSNCLAHEYFHYYHDCFATEEFNKSGRGNKSRERVKEALADYFSVVYTWLQAKKIYKDRPWSIEYKKYEDYVDNKYQQWKKREGSDWPYAYAYCFYTVKCGEYIDTPSRAPYTDTRMGCGVLFQEVLTLSREDMVKAFACLTKGTIKDKCDFIRRKYGDK